MLQYFSPSLFQLSGLGAVFLTIIVCAFYGALAGGVDRFAQVDIFAGLGMVTGAFTIIGVAMPAPFGWLAYGFWAGGLGAALFVWHRQRTHFPNLAGGDVWWRVLVLGFPLLVLVSAMKVSQWDEFSQWLPNAAFLYRFDGFPSREFAPSPSIFPAYPYAGPLVTYLVSRLTGFFVENAGGITNTVLLLGFAPVYLSVVKQGLSPKAGWEKTWGVAALGVLGVTVFSTVFVQKLIFTAYADTPTAVVLAVLGVLVWKILCDLSDGKQTPVSLAWQFSLVSALFVNLKQANPVLFGMLLAASLLVAWRDPAIAARRYLALWPRMLIAPVVVYLMWRYHVGRNLSAGEFPFLPFEDWHVAETFDILLRMASVAVRKGAYFGMMAVLAFFGILAIFRCRSAFDRLVMLTGTLFLGFNAFLWIMYVIAFDAATGPYVASFWRFNTQLGLLGCTTAALGLARLWRIYGVDGRWAPGAKRWLAGLGVLLVLGIPVATAPKLRFDLRPQKDHMRMVGRDIARILPDNANVAVIDPDGEGLSSVIIPYELWSAPGVEKNLRVTRLYKVRNKSRNRIAAEVARKDITHAWVHQVVAGVNASLGLDLATRQSRLLQWTGTGWRLIRSWPYQGYDDPRRLAD